MSTIDSLETEKLLSPMIIENITEFRKLTKAILDLNKNTLKIKNRLIDSHQNVDVGVQDRTSINEMLKDYKQTYTSLVFENLKKESIESIPIDLINMYIEDACNDCLSKIKQLLNLKIIENRELTDEQKNIPKAPIVKYPGRRYANPISFLKEHYGIWLKQDSATLDAMSLHRLDRSLYDAVYRHCKDKNIDFQSLFPRAKQARIARDGLTKKQKQRNLNYIKYST